MGLVAGLLAMAGLLVLLVFVLRSPVSELESDESAAPEPPVTRLTAAPVVVSPVAPEAAKQARVSVQGEKHKGPRPVTAPSRPAPEAPAAAPPNPHQRTSVGVPLCDDFLDKLAVCAATRVSPKRRRYLNGILPAYRRTWIRTVSSPGGRGSVLADCAKAAVHFKKTLAAAGCDW